MLWRGDCRDGPQPNEGMTGVRIPELRVLFSSTGFRDRPGRHQAFEGWIVPRGAPGSYPLKPIEGLGRKRSPDGGPEEPDAVAGRSSEHAGYDRKKQHEESGDPEQRKRIVERRHGAS